MREKQKILIVDDRKENLLVLRKLLGELDVDVVEATNGNDALAATIGRHFALAILDVNMPGMGGYELAEHLRGDEATKIIPIMFVTAAYGDEQHIFEGYASGGIDYIIKPFNTQLLLAKVRVFLELDQHRQELRRHRDDLQSIVAEQTGRLQHLNEVLRSIRDVNHLIVHEKRSNSLIQAACASLVRQRGFQGAWILLAGPDAAGVEGAQVGYDEDQFQQLLDNARNGALPACCRARDGKKSIQVIDNPSQFCAECPVATGYEGNASMAAALRHGDAMYGCMGVTVPLEFSSDEEEQGLLAEIASDIAFALHGIEMDRQRRAGQAEYKRLVEMLSEGIWSIDSKGLTTFVNPAMASMLGYTVEEMQGRHLFEFMDEKYVPDARRKMQEREKGVAAQHEFTFRRKDGSPIFTLMNTNPLKDEKGNFAGALASVADITQIRKAEAEKEAMEEQLQQAQKLESIGRLAGGVAHDFNNFLMAIMNCADFCRDEVPEDHPIREWLDEITRDSERSANLTKQLLAFARKQSITPVVLDLNDAVESTLKMLRRLIGEDIELSWQPSPHLWPIKIDPGQVDQLLANLCVNARDAIDGVGEVTIRTRNLTIDEKTAGRYVDAVPGDYSVLMVADNGCGMDPETRASIFEPFFTTKEVGQGTGLGLSTVYGIVKQNEGFVAVTSHPGEGTTFSIYLPRCGTAAGPAQNAKVTDVPPGKGETILLVEDEASIRNTMEQFLGKLGYTVMTAASPAEALPKVKDAGPIELVITDVIMPGMNGRQLVEKLLTDRPELKVIYMSGYTDNVVADQGVMDDTITLLNKPISRDVLARKIRELLDDEP